MGRIVQELKTLPGMILGLTFALIVTFYVLNFIATRGGPASGIGSWVFGHATGSAYGATTGAAAPAMAVSPYSANANSYM